MKKLEINSKQDVFTDPDSKEFKLLDGEAIENLAAMVDASVEMNSEAYERTIVRISDIANVLISERNAADLVEDAEGSELLRETSATIYQLDHSEGDIQRLTTVVLNEKLPARAGADDFESPDDATATTAFEDVYSIAKTTDGYEATVEQMNIAGSDGERTTRSMTEYDAQQLIRQLDESKIV